MECAGDELDEDCGTELWTNMIDRGGLWHVDDQTYSIFSIMEEEIRKYFRKGSYKQLNPDEVKHNVLKSNDLQFQWCLIAVEADDNIATIIAICYYPWLCICQVSLRALQTGPK